MQIRTQPGLRLRAPRRTDAPLRRESAATGQRKFSLLPRTVAWNVDFERPPYLAFKIFILDRSVLNAAPPHDSFKRLVQRQSAQLPRANNH